MQVGPLPVEAARATILTRLFRNIARWSGGFEAIPITPHSLCSNKGERKKRENQSKITDLRNAAIAIAAWLGAGRASSVLVNIGAAEFPTGIVPVGLIEESTARSCLR
jgi:hypothetical protein